MCSHVQQQQPPPSSAFESAATTFTRQSLLIRQKKDLTRDDSGVFSSPSPLTPSRGQFPLPPSPPPGVAYSSAISTAAPGSSSPLPTMSDGLVVDEELTSRPNASVAPLKNGVLTQAQDEPLLQAFYCRQEIGLERWATCTHTHCTTIRDDWRHLITCGQGCTHCQDFQRRILLHAAHCRDEGCCVTLCCDAKHKLESAVPKESRPFLHRTGSVQSSLGSPRPPQFLSLNSQGSLDDMSPMSPLAYPSFLRELHEIGAGTLPRHLQGTYSIRANEILQSLEADGPLDKLPPMGENSNPSSASSVPQGSKYNPVGAGILSPIEEHPSGDEGRKYPSQIVLHHLQPEFLTQGRDGRYLHRRDYDLNEHLGTGGFGTCACARDYKTDKMFVIKSNKFTDEKIVDTLRAESDILARIPRHSNITTFLGAVFEEEQAKEGPLRHCRLMMELAEHGSLAGMLQSDEGETEPLPLDQSLFYIYQILQGVFHLHSLSILHLDIKAENVLVLEGGRRVKLTDFGTAAHIDEIAGCISKLKGVTPHFTSPEIIRGDVPSFSSDIWSTICVLIQLLTAQLPGYFAGNVSRESMMYTLGMYKDEDIETLIPLSQLESQQDMPVEVSSIFRDTLCVDPTARPSALQLMAYTALKDACEYEQYFDIDCSQFSTEQDDESSSVSMETEGAEFVSMGGGAESLPHLIVRSLGPDSDVSLDIPTRAKRPSQDSGVSSHYERKQSEVYPIGDPNDSGVDTPGQELYKGALKLQALKSREGVICEDRDGEERFTAIPDRTHSQPEPPAVDYSLIASQYRRRSMSATYNRRTSDATAPELMGLKFGQPYADTNETFFSLPNNTSSGFVMQTQKVRPNFVHLIHSNSAPMVMSDNKERGAAAAGGVADKQNGGSSGRLRRSSSEVYVDRGPDIDTPEEKKKKRELELAAAAAKEAEERERQEQEQLVTMAAALRINNSSPEAWSPPMQRSHTHSAGVDQSDRGSGGDYVTGYRTRQNVQQEAAAPQAQRHLPYHVQQRPNGTGGYTKETLV